MDEKGMPFVILWICENRKCQKLKVGIEKTTKI